MDKMKQETPNLTEQNIDRIAALFPNCVTEATDESGKIKRAVNFELLKQMLSPDVVDGDECYEFTWVGKKAAIAEANRPIRKTLRPCVEESKDWDNTENLVYRGRQSGSPQAFAGKLSRQGQDEIYRYKDTKIDTI